MTSVRAKHKRDHLASAFARAILGPLFAGLPA